ncbi:MAG: cytochrome B [Cyanobacteriota bacterium]|nr:cytochrome B [Cyanobacteriota bacterium]
MGLVPPYQPSLLRILHGAMVVLVPLAWLSGLLVYSIHDGRFGGWVVRPAGDWIDIHGTLGVLLWPLALLFVLYAITLGRARLQQPANGAALVALTLAVGSGKLMNEVWLRSGQLHHLVYNLHLLSWVLVAGAALAHVVAVVRRGGMAFAGSMFQLRRRSHDQPWHWWSQIRAACRRSLCVHLR